MFVKGNITRGVKMVLLERGVRVKPPKAIEVKFFTPTGFLYIYFPANVQKVFRRIPLVQKSAGTRGGEIPIYKPPNI